METVGVGVSARRGLGEGKVREVRERWGAKKRGRGGVPEHRSARDLPDPVGDSNRAFSPLSAALRTLPMTPCAVERVGWGQTEGAKISGSGGGRRGDGRGCRVGRRMIVVAARIVARRRRTSCDAYGLNGKCTS